MTVLPEPRLHDTDELRAVSALRDYALTAVREPQDIPSQDDPSATCATTS